MPQYIAPGVFVEETSMPPRPIEGVATSTVGFVGATGRGPAKPRLVTSLADFERIYGGVGGAGSGVFALAMRGFFDNGGRRAIVARSNVGAFRKGTREAIRRALDRLEAVDDIAILCVPEQGQDLTIASDMVAQCERRRDRFAILQGEAGFTDAAQFQQALPRSSFCAVYHPWIRVFDSSTGGSTMLPPAGHVAGAYAANDMTRGVHKAPANIVLRGLYLRETPAERTLSQQIDHQRHDLYNAAGVSIIRDFRAHGRGIVLWGARTFGSDPEWRYVPVRRLFMFLEESIEKGTQWSVFEPNDHNTWAAVRRQVQAFLLEQWRGGALAGEKPDQAFFVRCDRSTMTQADIDAGRLICQIGVAPVKPAEFIIFRIVQQAATT